MVAFEHNPASVSREKMRSVFYYTPGKGITRITTWADHVYDSNIAFQFGFCKFVNGKLLLPMEGADRAYYVGLIDENGREVELPYAIPKPPSKRVAIALRSPSPNVQVLPADASRRTYWAKGVSHIIPAP